MNEILLIVLIAVLGPVIGSLIGILRKPSSGFMFNMLSFAAGVMLAISFMQLIPQSIKLSSPAFAIFGVLIGSVLMFGVDRIIPHIHHGMCSQEHGSNLKKTSLYLLLGIAMHNFPEGMAIGAGIVSSLGSGVAIALAIALHDIPEGICTSAPYYAYSRKKLKSFVLSSLTIIPTLLGFIFSYYLFNSITPQYIGLIIAATAGIMIYIVGDELIPSSCAKITNHDTIFSMIIGIILSILLVSIR